MVLLSIISDSVSYLDKKLLIYAANHTPSLVIDCANTANPHSIYPSVSIEQMKGIYVIELELLYKFRDVLKRVPSIMRKIKGNHIIITTSDHLFNYHDKLENYNITDHAWEMIRQLGNYYTIIAAIKKGSAQEKFAIKYSHKMGVCKNGTYSAKPKEGSGFNNHRTQGIFKGIKGR